MFLKCPYKKLMIGSWSNQTHIVMISHCYAVSYLTAVNIEVKVNQMTFN